MHNLSKLEFSILMGLLAIMAGLLSCKAVKDVHTVKAMDGRFEVITEIVVTPYIVKYKEDIPTPTPTSTPTPTLTPTPAQVAPEATLGAESAQTEGFRYYQIPKEYVNRGGDFPEAVQEYLWAQCKERGIDYYIAVALIERESGYTHSATGDNGNSKGYMQIYEKWHKSRMSREGVKDLYDPYGNIRVGLNFLQSIKKYNPEADYHFILMSYNMGVQRAEELYAEGVYTSKYSRYIMRRAQEIKQELQEYK